MSQVLTGPTSLPLIMPSCDRTRGKLTLYTLQEIYSRPPVATGTKYANARFGDLRLRLDCSVGGQNGKFTHTRTVSWFRPRSTVHAGILGIRILPTPDVETNRTNIWYHSKAFMQVVSKKQHLIRSLNRCRMFVQLIGVRTHQLIQCTSTNYICILTLMLIVLHTT
jgi:hypothetical protein